ncbi:MAG: sugar transferase [Sporichthyaceae bacterium]
MSQLSERRVVIPQMRVSADPVSARTDPPPAPAPAPGPDWRRGYVLGSLAVDVVAALCATGMALVARFGSAFPADYLYGSLAMVPVWIALVAIFRGYDRRVVGIGAHEFTRVARAGGATLVAVALLSYVTKAEFARGYVFVAVPAVVLLAVAGRGFQRAALHWERRQGRCLQRTMLVGPGEEIQATTHRLRRDAAAGMTVVAACATDGIAALPDLHLPLRAGVVDLEAALAAVAADTVVVLPGSGIAREELRRLAWRLEATGTELLVCPGLTEVAVNRVVVRPTAHSALLQVTPARLSGPARVAKGVFDRTAAVAGLLAISPLLVGVALAIKLGDRGPVFFRQQRVGIDGREFAMVKFRTMVVDAEARRSDLEHLNESDGVLFKIAHDPRITPLGRWLRRYSVDELPQLLNVVRGEMSLVGPRPPLPDEVARYSSDMRRRLAVKPGLTGLWQVSGRSSLTWAETETLDIRYVENWSLAADVVILARTARAVLRGSGAH